MWQNTLDSGVVKWFINLGTSIIKVVDSLGLIPSILGAIGLSKFVPWVLKLATHTNTFGVALATILKPLVQLKGSGQTLTQIFAQTAAGAMNAAGGVSTFSAYLKAAGATLKAFVSTPLGWFTIAAIAIGAVVGAVDLLTTSTKELKEKLENLKSELSNIKSEIDSLNSELETTQSRIAELTAMGSLSFTEEEELRNLKLQNAELERQIKLQEEMLKFKQEEQKNTAKELINSKWNSDKTDKSYAVDNDGVITEDNWNTVGANTKEALGIAFDKYEEQKKIVENNRELYQKLLESNNKNQAVNYETWKQIRMAQGFNENQLTKDMYKSYGWDKVGKQKELLDTFLNETVKSSESKLQNISNGITMVMKDMSDIISQNNLSYSMGDQEIDKLLDEYYAYAQKWSNMQGLLTKSDVINSIFDDTSSDGIKKLKSQLEEISKSSDDEAIKQQKAQKLVQNAIDNTTGEYDRLKTTMETVGVTAEEIANYFTLKSGEFDSDTISGITAQYQKGIEVLQRFNSDKTQIEEELKQYGEGGTVDLLNRPQIDTTKLVEAGWKDAGDGIATVFSSTYSNEDSTIAINFTPILPDGSVLSPDELQEYAEGVIAGTREDDLKLQIGAVFEGEDAITQATAAAEEIHNLQDIYYLPLEIELEDGTIETVEWADLFDWDEAEKEATANAEAISKVLEGADENTREQFGNLVESVAEGKLDFEQAIKSFSLSGIIASTKILEDQWAEVNKTMFKSIDDGVISGWIDTFSELSAALEDVASSMDLLHSAQQQMNGSGRISIKTALELIEATDQWDQMLTITEGTIRLNANAEDILVQSKLNVIKAQVDEALGAVELQLAQLGAADSAYTVAIASDVSDEAYEQYTNAMNSYSASIAAFGAALDAMVSRRWGDVISDFSSTYETAKKIANSSVDTSRIDRTDLEKQRRDLQAQKNMLNQVGTVSSFKNNYDYEKTPGDKYEDKDSDKDKKTAKDLFDELAAEYDRKISTIEYKKDLIQSEIDKAEARGEVASEAFYQRQIELEEKNRQALVNKKKALEDYLKAQGKNMTKEEWADAQEEINSTALAIEECEKNVIDLGQAIDDVHWEYFDKFTSEVDDLGDENATLLSLVGDTDDAVDENGNWTASGVTQIGLNTQEMQRNLEMANQMDKEKNRIQKSWNEYQRVLAKHGGDASKVTNKEKKAIQKKYGVLITSESEYQEKMQETSQKQRDYAKAAKDSKDAIEDLAKARVDKEVEAIEKEIDAYKELIDLKREELQSERD